MDPIMKRIFDMRRQGARDAEIAAATGLTRAALGHRMRRWNLKNPHDPVPPSAHGRDPAAPQYTTADVKAVYIPGMRARDLAARLDMPVWRATRLLQAAREDGSIPAREAMDRTGWDRWSRYRNNHVSGQSGSMRDVFRHLTPQELDALLAERRLDERLLAQTIARLLKERLA